MRSDRYYSLSVFNQKPHLNAADWACKYRYMPSTSTLFSFDLSPYFKLPTSYMSDIAETACVIIKCPSQTGKSEALLNMLGWVCEYDRANTMLVFDTLKSGTKFSKNRIRPFLRDVCGINNPNNTAKNPDKSNSVFDIGLGRGANLTIASSKSPNDLASNPVKYLLLDELDRYPDELKGEGDPVMLALQRQLRFRGMAVMSSSPTTCENRIYQNFLLGTQQTWGCLCECGAFMDVRFDDINFSGDIPTYSCKKCGLVYAENDIKSLEHCYSDPRNNNPFIDDYGRIWRSFEVFGTLCHSFYSWKGLKRQEQQALALGDASYRSFLNTRLGELYKEIDSAPEIPELMQNSRSQFGVNTIPDDAVCITIGVDTHDNCLYSFVCAWSIDGKKIYALDYSVLPGDPDDSCVWDMLNDIMSNEYVRSDGKMLKPAFAFIDSGGHRTAAVYRSCMKNKRYMPIKGYVTNNKRAQDPLIGELKKIKIPGYKTKAWTQMIGVNAGKDDLRHKIQLTCSGEQRLFYPKFKCFDDEYFSGLLSETKIDGRWRQISNNNEPLDTFIYAFSAFIYYKKRYIVTGKDKAVLEADDMSRTKRSEKKEKKSDEKKMIPVEDKQEIKKDSNNTEPNKKHLPKW